MRKYARYILSFIIMLYVVTYIYGEQGENNNLYGFKKFSEDYIENIDSNVIIYNHSVSGAQVIHVKNTDPNQVFAIGFKTPIYDNTGVNHIVEHAVFTGSEKYNTKDVFFEMKKKSPNIYMNASTAADMTIYPFSTRNHKDYSNLLDVYLDAVFFPNLQKQRYGFDQEGWHYSIDKDEKFHMNGVVYNEMKGASVIPRRILAMANRAAMFPDTMYIYNAGGNPDEIPNLSYEKCKETHKAYYVPSNSCAFIYGDVDIEQVLIKLDSYYSRFVKEEAQDISQKQQPFETMKYYKDYYPSASQSEDYFVSTNYAVGEIEDIKLQLSMEILMDILIQYEESPLKKVFNQKQSSKTLSYDVDSVIPQPMYSIIATDVKKDDIKEVELLIQQTLEKTAKEGFNNDVIKMAINNYEIKAKQRISDISKGREMAYSAIYSWGHGVSPVKMLQSQKFIEEIKNEGDSLYFQKLLQRYILENNHTAQVVLAPDETYIAKAQEKEIQSMKMEFFNNNLENKEVINKNKADLEQWQQSGDRVFTLPQLKLEDINQSTPLPQLVIKEDKNNKRMYYIAHTNDLIYIDLYFDTSYIPKESLNELFLFSYLIGEREKDLVALYTGGMSCSTIAIPKSEKYNDYDPKLKLSLCIKKENIDKAFQILDQVTLKENIWDEKWILTQIRKIRTQYESYFNSKPLELMNVAVNNTQDGASRYEYEKIMPFYQYICEIEENYNVYKDQIAGKLEIIKESVFNQDNIIMGATLEDKNIKSLEKSYKRYFKKLKNEQHPKVSYTFDTKEKRQGFPIASDVQYIVWGGNYKQKGGAYNGYLYVLGNILNAEYMLKNARVKNGAYGAGVNFNPYGNMNIYTYQDPQLPQTLQMIEDIPKYIEKFDVEDEVLDEYKIGALSKFEQELGLNEHPKVTGEILQEYYLSGISYEMLEKVRQEIFQTTVNDIKNQGLVLEKLIEDKRYSVAGSESRLLTNSQHFDIIQSFQDIYNYIH